MVSLRERYFILAEATVLVGGTLADSASESMLPLHPSGRKGSVTVNRFSLDNMLDPTGVDETPETIFDLIWKSRLLATRFIRHLTILAERQRQEKRRKQLYGNRLEYRSYACSEPHGKMQI